MTDHDCSDPECAVCSGRESPGDLLAQIEGHIASHGFSAIGVLSDDPELEGFTYTVGFTRTWGHPELVITGLDPREAGGILRDVAARVREGERFDVGPEYEDIVGDGYKVRFIAVDGEARDEHFRIAARLQPDGFEALQLVWPAADHTYTVSPEAQPILGTLL